MRALEGSAVVLLARAAATARGGAVAVNGRRVDRPVLLRAQALLAHKP